MWIEDNLRMPRLITTEYHYLHSVLIGKLSVLFRNPSHKLEVEVVA